MVQYFVFVTVNPHIIHHPVPQLAIPNCVVNFTCIAVSSPPPAYNWITPIEDNNFNSSTILWEYEDVKPEHIGDYTCTVSSNGVMVRSNTVYLTGMQTLAKMCDTVYTCTASRTCAVATFICV